jgi:hypothetical protein
LSIDAPLNDVHPSQISPRRCQSWHQRIGGVILAATGAGLNILRGLL